MAERIHRTKLYWENRVVFCTVLQQMTSYLWHGEYNTTYVDKDMESSLDRIEY